MASRNRIPYPDPARLSAAKRAYLDAPNLRVLNVARMTMHLPDAMWRATVDMALACVNDTSISARMREVVIMRVAALSASEYELHHHRSICRAIGMSEAEIAGLENGAYTGLNDAEQAVARFTTEVVRDVMPADDTVAAMRGIYSDEQVFEIMAIIGSYMITARMVAVANIDCDEIAVTTWDRERGE